MCSAFNAFLDKTVTAIKGALPGRAPKAKIPQGLATPWMTNLERLADQRKDEDAIPEAAPQVHTSSVTAFVNELAKNSGPKSPYAPPDPTQKQRRTADGTVTDLKGWWGDAVATWDPETNGKNVDSSDQRHHTRSAKWFTK